METVRRYVSGALSLTTEQACYWIEARLRADNGKREET
jgi:hypothetical protein